MLELWSLQSSCMLRTDLTCILIEVYLGGTECQASLACPAVIVLTEGNQFPESLRREGWVEFRPSEAF